ncbi:LysR family transcriptional regulator [Massilia sp. erpn]|uniref:LysR family transcriptional regulator n=1 Tax=Massilia sp. erpn TaxID=2738142 RepID=UPI002102D57E|nr:LysR family transcriptional regulator [Massilia sp. erpn]UTY57954.1 LysR family transcriptional regulator [Massilia sp. erpn]
MDLLNAMQSFRRVVERNSFNKAAAELGLSPAGIGKQVRWLEQRLNAVLLSRTTRTMSLTDTGHAYYQECCRLLDELDSLERATAADSVELSGRLRLNAPLSFSVAVLGPLLARFMAAYPQLKVELTLTDRVLDVVSEGFDLSLRVRTALPDSSLVARPLGKVEQLICAAPAYLAARGTPAIPAELAQHDCLAYRLAEMPGRWALRGPEGETLVTLPVRFSADNSLMLAQMLAAGAGIGTLPSFVARSLLDEGRLRTVLPGYSLAARTAYAVYPSNRHLPRKVRVLLDFLAEELPALL